MVIRFIIVTADHAHSSQIIEADVKSSGLTQALITKDGAVMVVNYGNSETDSTRAYRRAITALPLMVHMLLMS